MADTFEVTGWLKFSELDDYEQGCDPDSTQVFTGQDRFSASTVPELLVKLQEFAGSDDVEDVLLDSCEEEGRVDIQVMEDENGYSASNSDVALWKQGKVKLYFATYTFHVEHVVRSPVSLTSPSILTLGG